MSVLPGTNFAAGIRLAVTELASLHGARSAPRPEATKILMFLTDGVPSFPFGSSRESDPGDTEAALGAAERCIEQSGARLLEAQLHEARAEWTRFEGDEAALERELREAHRLFVQMGATGHAERLARELGL